MKNVPPEGIMLACTPNDSSSDATIGPIRSLSHSRLWRRLRLQRRSMAVIALNSKTGFGLHPDVLADSGSRISR